MSQQNPTIPTATQAKGVDAAVNDLQTALSFDLSWLTNGMGRAYRRNKTRSNGSSAFLPMVYLGTNFSNDFFNATPDNDKEGQSIILVGDATHTDYQAGFYGWLEYPISIIFSANLDTIDSALLATEDFTEHLMEDVRDSLRGLLGKSYRLAIVSETREFEDVYSEFDISVGNTSKPLLPMTYFRFECTLTVKEDCGNNTLNRCQAILQNLTSTDLNECILPTYDFSDATVQSNVTVQQKTDLSDWICTMSPSFYTLFDGINELLTGDTGGVYDIERTDPFSVSFQFKPTSLASTTFLIGKRTSLIGWGVQITSAGKINFIIRSGVYATGTALDVNTNFSVISVGVVYKCTITYDGTGVLGGVKIYLNSQSLPLVTAPGATSCTSGTTINTENIQIGGIPLLGRYFVGGMYNAAMWNISLSAAQVVDDYNGVVTNRTARNSPANLIMWNKMGDGAIIGANIFYPDDSGASSGYNSVNMDSSNIVQIL